MKYLSLFSGIEAATVAWKPLGWECVAVSEILPYQSSVIAKHFPEIKNLGDVTKITEEDIKSLGKIDVVIFGSPCQDMSVAGKRMGLEAEKEDTNHSSILFFEGMRVFRLAQEHCGARFLVWENVPGALTSNQGLDFGKIISTMVGVGFNSDGLVWRNEGICFGADSMLEWSVLDAQWFGVAQRRRRLFIVLDTGDWQNRRPILLESKSLRGDTPPSRETQEKSSRKIEKSIDSAILEGLDIFYGHSEVCYDMQAMGEYGDKNVASTLKGRDYKDATDLIVEEDYTCAIVSNIIGRDPETRAGGNGTGFNEEVMYTLTGADHHAVAYEKTVKCFQQNVRNEVRYINGDGEIAGALMANSGAKQTNYIHIEDPAVAYSFDSMSSNSMKSKNPVSGCNEVDVSKTIDTSGINPTCNQGGIAILTPPEMHVRRLTPVECERLQGFPDNWTKVDDNTAFSKRINALGRSMAVPVIRWIGEQIENA